MRLAGLLLALFTLAQPVRAEADLLVCKMSGAVLRACCCPEKPAQQRSAIEHAGCCDGIHLEAQAPASRTVAQATHDFAPAVLVAALPSLGAASVVHDGPAEVHEGNPRATTGPPRVPVYLSVLHLLG